MVGRLNRGSLVFVAGALVAVVTACGGQSQRHVPDEAGSGGAVGGSGAVGGTGGSGAVGGSGFAGGCTYNGIFYRPTATFPATDGCNTCKCESGGNVVCTRTACTDCQTLPGRYMDALAEARRCDPRLRIEQCLVPASSGVFCGCTTYVNDDSELKSLASEHQALMCSGPLGCGACPEPPARGRCSEDNVCVDEYVDL